MEGARGTTWVEGRWTNREISYLAWRARKQNICSFCTSSAAHGRYYKSGTKPGNRFLLAAVHKYVIWLWKIKDISWNLRTCDMHALSQVSAGIPNSTADFLRRIRPAGDAVSPQIGTRGPFVSRSWKSSSCFILFYLFLFFLLAEQPPCKSCARKWGFLTRCSGVGNA